MFTGIIERTGRVVSITGSSDAAMGKHSITQLIVEAGDDYHTDLGDSVAINGCCLTVTSNKMKMLAFDVSSETLACTNLEDLEEGKEVNLERAMRLGDRLGGHIVSGHVDGFGEIVNIQKRVDGWDIHVSLEKALGRYLIPKGSVCIDGVSLTVNMVKDSGNETVISVMLIPTTVSLTNLKNLHLGQRVNIEVDMLSKYVERLVAARGMPP